MTLLLAMHTVLLMARELPSPPTFLELRRECRAFAELADAMYSIATEWIAQNWEDVDRVADAVVVFLLMWNKAFYMRFGPPSQKLLVRFLNRYRSTLQKLRVRSILEFDPQTDGPLVAELFSKLLLALAPRRKSQAKQRRTPVGVAKTLHLLAPQLLPLWDNRIASAYRCSWANPGEAANRYISFICRMQQLCGQVLQDYARRYPTEAQDAAEALVTACATRYSTRCLLKLVDQYNYMRFVHRHGD